MLWLIFLPETLSAAFGTGRAAPSKNRAQKTTTILETPCNHRVFPQSLE
jgi:hypothetical protein